MITSKDLKNIVRLVSHLEKHRKLNQQHYRHRWLVGAMLYDRNRVVVGYNHYTKTHPLTYQNQDYTIPIHAEIDAISKWIRQWRVISNTTTLYVVGMTKSHQFSKSSKPCDSCMEAIRRYDISRIVYTVSEHSSFTLKETLLN